MAIIGRVRVRTILEAGDRAATTRAQGNALEEATAYVFSKIPGVTLHDRQVRNVFGVDETDLIFINNRGLSGVDVLDVALIVECKNLTRPVGFQSVQDFAAMLENKGASSGVLVASNGLTGEPGHDAYRALETALTRGRRIVVLTRADLESMATTDQLVRLITIRYMDLVTYGTFRP
jgi:hypothetical protein